MRYDLSINTQARYIWLKISKPFLLKKKCKSNDANDNANDDDMSLTMMMMIRDRVCLPLQAGTTIMSGHSK